VDFTPLKVDYFERFSAAGLTSGSFTKRDGRASDREILISRLIDRPIRPMLTDAWNCETQVRE
jgi:polyribonucleotide nucleotidyltransferase